MSLVRPPTAAQDSPSKCHAGQDSGSSVDQLLELLRGEGPHGFGRGLRLEDARLLREGVDALPRRTRRLLLELEALGTGELDEPNLDEALHDSLHVLALHPC